MDRRRFLRNAAVLAAGAVAADQMEIVERLTHTRRFFPSATLYPILYGDGVTDDSAALQALVDGLTIVDARTGQRLQSPHVINGGRFHLRRTIHLGGGRGEGVSIWNSHFTTAVSDGPAFHIHAPFGDLSSPVLTGVHVA